MKLSHLSLVVAFLSLIVVAQAQSVASWIIGDFEGRNTLYGSSISLSISDLGEVKAVTTKGRSAKSQTGRIRDGKMLLDGASFSIERAEDGFVITQTDNRRNSTRFRRVEDSGTWCVGSFTGYNSRYSANIIIDLNEDGRATAQVRSSRSAQTQTGFLRDSVLTLDNIRFDVSKTRDGFRLVQISDRSNSCEYRRVGEGGMGSDSLPSWLVGAFDGYNSNYDSYVFLSVSSAGNAIARVTDRDGRAQIQKGGYRNGRLVLDEVSFRVSSELSGIRSVQSDDRANEMQYKRLNSNAIRSAERPPSWLRGSFKGHNNAYDTEVTIMVTDEGYAVARVRTRDGRTQSQYGCYKNRAIYLDGIAFSVSEQRRGLRVTQKNEPENRADYSRIN